MNEREKMLLKRLGKEIYRVRDGHLAVSLILCMLKEILDFFRDFGLTEDFFAYIDEDDIEPFKTVMKYINGEP